MAQSSKLGVARWSVTSCGGEEESFRAVAAADDHTDDDDVISEAERTTNKTRLTSFLSMSRVKQLTVISFSLSNLGVGCFFSVLGPFFPTEVCTRIHNTLRIQCAVYDNKDHTHVACARLCEYANI